MSDTPRSTELFNQFGPVPNHAAMAYYSLCCELERELIEAYAELRKLNASAVFDRSVHERSKRPRICAENHRPD